MRQEVWVEMWWGTGVRVPKIHAANSDGHSSAGLFRGRRVDQTWGDSPHSLGEQVSKPLSIFPWKVMSVSWGRCNKRSHTGGPGQQRWVLSHF